MKYKLSGEVTISVITEIEAESKEEAIEKSYENNLEFQSWTSDSDYKNTWIASELDGEVQNIEVIE